MYDSGFNKGFWMRSCWVILLQFQLFFPQPYFLPWYKTNKLYYLFSRVHVMTKGMKIWLCHSSESIYFSCWYSDTFSKAWETCRMFVSQETWATFIKLCNEFKRFSIKRFSICVTCQRMTVCLGCFIIGENHHKNNISSVYLTEIMHHQGSIDMFKGWLSREI